MSKKKKKSIFDSAFYRVYFAVIIVVLIAIGVGAIWLNGTLKDYESAQPVYVAEKVAQLFENHDYENIYAVDTSAAEIAGSDKAFYVESMREIADGKDVAWSAAFSPEADEQRYSVTIDGERFATFTLVPSGMTTPRGNTLWALGSVTTHVAVDSAPEEPVEVEEALPVVEDVKLDFHITAPSDSVVTVDGRELTADDAVRTDIPAMATGFLPASIAMPTLTEYAFSSDNEEPEISVIDRNGEPQELTQDGDTTWSCGLAEDAELRERYGRSVLAVAEKLAKFTSNDLEQYTMLGETLRDSPAYNIIKNFDNQWATPHSRVAFRNVVTDQYYLHSADCVTCHVGFDYVLHNNSTGIDKVYTTSYTFCFVRSGNTAKLYNMILN